MKGRESGMPDGSYWETFFNPRCIVEKLDCRGNCGDVLEFGCGYGTFTIAAGQMVSGRVFALDIEPVMLSETHRKAEEAGLSNVITIKRDFISEGSGLADQSIGYAMMFNILHVEEPILLLKEAFRVLTPGGKLGVIHWRTDVPTPRGPSLDIRPSANTCRTWAESVGFEIVRDESLCCCSWHWGLVMRRP